MLARDVSGGGAEWYVDCVVGNSSLLERLILHEGPPLQWVSCNPTRPRQTNKEAEVGGA